MNIDLILLSVSLLMWGTGEGMFIYFQPIYLQQLGANTMTIAWIFGLFGLAMMVAHIPAGHLSDRIGRKPLLLAAWALGIPATILMGLARSLPVFIVGMLIYGLTAFVISPLNSYVTAARGRLSPARAMTLVSAFYNLGAVLGPISGGWVGVRLGLRNVYLISAFIFVISTAVLAFVHPQPCEVHDPASPPESLWKNARFISFLGIIFLAVFAMYLPQPLTPRYLQNERGLSLENIGLLGSIGNLGNTVLALALGQVAARSGFLLAQGSVAVFALVLWKSSGLGWYALGYFLLGGYRSARSLIDAQIRPLIHPAQMGLAYGVAETASALAVMLAPLLAGVLYTQKPEMVYWVSALMIGVILVISAIFAPRTVGSIEQSLILPPPER
ncbi:MAG TPA: MFS transporter [Anaerolineales bacterium]|nr:MFS transporter [Anaerolineales bacterium]